ncbi:MAG: hypothetical protein ACOC6G_04265, partial [Thermoproteota archaeon]
MALDRDKSAIKIRCTSSILSPEKTELLTKFIQGTMHTLGYKTQDKDQTKGIILLEYTEHQK